MPGNLDQDFLFPVANYLKVLCEWLKIKETVKS